MTGNHKLSQASELTSQQRYQERAYIDVLHNFSAIYKIRRRRIIKLSEKQPQKNMNI